MNTEELSKIPLLQSVEREALARLAGALEARNHTEGQTIFAEGEPGDSMYFIVKGCIRIEKQTQEGAGAHKILTVLESGDYFGEMALLDQEPRSASAVAAGDVRLLRLSKVAFDQMQSGSSAAGMSVLFAMIRTSSERIRRLSAQVIVYDEVGKAIGEAQDLQKLLDIILRQLLAATSADSGLVLLRSQFSDTVEVCGKVNMSLTAVQREALSSGKGIVGPILNNPRDRLVANLDEDEAFKSCPRLGFETPSLILTPISVEGQFLGVIILGGKERDQFDVNALHLARGVARQAAQAILNARYREEQQARSRHARQYVRF